MAEANEGPSLPTQQGRKFDLARLWPGHAEKAAQQRDLKTMYDTALRRLENDGPDPLSVGPYSPGAGPIAVGRRVDYRSVGDTNATVSIIQKENEQARLQLDIHHGDPQNHSWQTYFIKKNNDKYSIDLFMNNDEQKFKDEELVDDKRRLTKKGRENILQTLASLSDATRIRLTENATEDEIETSVSTLDTEHQKLSESAKTIVADDLLDQYNQGKITKEEFEEKMKRLVS